MHASNDHIAEINILHFLFTLQLRAAITNAYTLRPTSAVGISGENAEFAKTIFTMTTNQIALIRLFDQFCNLSNNAGWNLKWF